jgi:hypothetical protein
VVAGVIAAMLIVVLIPAVVPAQVESEEELERNLPIGLTEEEKTRLHETGMAQTATDPPPISTPSGAHHIDVWAKLLSEETILVQEV